RTHRQPPHRLRVRGPRRRPPHGPDLLDDVRDPELAVHRLLGAVGEDEPRRGPRRLRHDAHAAAAQRPGAQPRDGALPADAVDHHPLRDRAQPPEVAALLEDAGDQQEQAAGDVHAVQERHVRATPRTTGVAANRLVASTAVPISSSRCGASGGTSSPAANRSAWRASLRAGPTTVTAVQTSAPHARLAAATIATSVARRLPSLAKAAAATSRSSTSTHPRSVAVP